MANPIEIFQTKATTAADALALINGVFQWAFGPTPPSITFPYLNWADTGTNSWYQRNADDNAWIFKGALDSAFAPMDGWIDGLNLIYVSSTSIKIESMDVRDRIQQGTKIRYKQGGEYKYDFVSEISFTIDSVLTLMGGSTVEDLPITDFAYSSIANPIGWPFGCDYIGGSNTNGTWKKWVDGTLECWATASWTGVNITNPQGAIYVNSETEVIFQATWPHAFIDTTSLEQTNVSIRTSNAPRAWLIYRLTANVTQTTRVFVARDASSTDNALTLVFYGKGRWNQRK